VHGRNHGTLRRSDRFPGLEQARPSALRGNDADAASGRAHGDRQVPLRIGHIEGAAREQRPKIRRGEQRVPSQRAPDRSESRPQGKRTAWMSMNQQEPVVGKELRQRRFIDLVPAIGKRVENTDIGSLHGIGVRRPQPGRATSVSTRRPAGSTRNGPCLSATKRQRRRQPRGIAPRGPRDPDSGGQNFTVTRAQ